MLASSRFDKGYNEQLETPKANGRFIAEPAVGEPGGTHTVNPDLSVAGDHF